MLPVALVTLTIWGGETAFGQQPPGSPTPRIASPEWWERFLWDMRITDLAAVLLAVATLLAIIILGTRMGRLWKAVDGLWKVVEGQRSDMQVSLEIARQSAHAATDSAQAITAQSGQITAALAIAENAATAADESSRATAESIRVIAAQAGQVTSSLGLAETAAAAADVSAKAALQAATAAEKQLTDLTASVTRARDAADSARELATAAKQQADTAVAVDRPHVFVSGLRLHGLKQPPDAQGLVPVSMTYEFANYGRSPAVIRGIFLSVGTNPPPDTPTYGAPNTVRQVIPVHGVFRSVRPVEVFRLPPAVIAKVQSSETPVVAYGYVDYTDPFGHEHRSAFLYEFSFRDADESAGFHPAGLDAFWHYS